MRETFGTLIKTSKDFCVDDKNFSSTTLTNTELFIKREINRTVQFMSDKLKKIHKTKSLPKTMSTTINRQYYYYPPGLNTIDTITIDNDTTIPPLRVVHSQSEWDRLNALPSTSGIPSHIFMRAHDFGLFPIPKDTYTLTLVGHFHPRAMYAADYQTGSIAIAQNSQTLTGTDTTFTAAMVGRYVVESDGEQNIGNFYRLGGFTSTTVMTLETFFEEASLSGAVFTIGESPELPEELHELIPYRVANIYYGTKRRDSKKAQEYSNFFWTGDWGNPRRQGVIEGGLLGYLQEYAKNGSDNSQVFNLNEPVRHSYLSEEWEEVTT